MGKLKLNGLPILYSRAKVRSAFWTPDPVLFFANLMLMALVCSTLWRIPD